MTFVAAPSAFAVNWLPTPPKCVQNQWYGDGKTFMYFYSKAYEYRQTRIYGGTREVRYIWVFDVQSPMYPYGMVTQGRAERHCGSDFYRSWA